MRPWGVDTTNAALLSMARPMQSVRAMEAVMPGIAGSHTAVRCAHCASALPSGSLDAYCCEGCRAVATLLRDGGLDRYYELGGGAEGPVSLAAPGRDRPWLDALATRVAETEGVACVDLDVQGMHCAGCVWLMSTLFDRASGGVDAIANAALGRVSLRVERGFDLPAYVDQIERFGYRVGPALKSSPAVRDTLLVRTGVALGLAANAMMFALAIYLGLRTGPVYETMRTLELVLAAATVLVGAPVFFRGAMEGLRRGVLHLDLPIAIGMTLALAGSVAAYVTGASAAYGDTVAIFVALMLLGRWLEQRAVSRNRDRLLASEGAGGVFARRIEASEVRSVRAREIREGDALLVAPSEIVVVDAISDEPATVSLDWISGESTARTAPAGTIVPAGAVQRGRRALRMRAMTSFDRSPLEMLLGRTAPERDARSPSAFWDRVTRVYVVAVLVVATAAFGAWWIASGDVSRALEVATAVLVVTCPCGIGIATPLAYELVTSALRRRGLFVRRERALDRAADVRRVAFDKTGTLTTGRLELEDASSLDAMSAMDRAALGELVARSAHPKSEAVRRALGDAITIRDDVTVDELAGRGLTATIDGHAYRLGAPEWAAPGASGDLVLARDGSMVLALRTREVLRTDAAREVGALESEGYEVSILSGDASDRTRAVAARLGLADTEVQAECSPEDKAHWIDAHVEPTLFVGDGINDGLAADRAALSGTPAIDRPFLPSRTDFFFVTAGLAPIRALLDGGRALRRVAKRNLAFAIAYNALVVTLAVAGLMRPWLAAIAMPASSLIVITATTWSLRESRWNTTEGSAWTS